jgi:nucleotide-binding universal stress UspA family protein
MSEVVLVVLRRPDAAAGLLAGAGKLALLMRQAHLNVLAVRHLVLPGALAAEALMSEADAYLAAEQAELDRIEALRAAYDVWLGGPEAAELTSRWIEVDGSPGSVVGETGGRADIVVCARPAEADHLARQEFSAALFGTDRPVLVLPPCPAVTIGHRVAIAWRDEKRALRAVIPSLRWLAQAHETHVFMGLRDDTMPAALPRVFTEHGIRPELHMLRIGPGPFGQALLDKAHELSIDLLIMGAYAHSPLRELILGGVTRYMLAHADLPVLMRH